MSIANASSATPSKRTSPGARRASTSTQRVRLGRVGHDEPDVLARGDLDEGGGQDFRRQSARILATPRVAVPTAAPADGAARRAGAARARAPARSPPATTRGAASTAAARSADARDSANMPAAHATRCSGPIRNWVSPTAATSSPTLMSPDAASRPPTSATSASSRPPASTLAASSTLPAAAARTDARSEAALTAR